MMESLEAFHANDVLSHELLAVLVDFKWGTFTFRNWTYELTRNETKGYKRP